MASYFDLPTQQKTGAANIEAVPEEQRKELGCMSFLSPAVTQLLDDLGQEKSDSDSEEGNLSEDETKRIDEHTKKNEPPKTSQTRGSTTQISTTTSPLAPKQGNHSSDKKPARVKSPPARTGGSTSAKHKQPHMARFHSLRSMLFSNTIEDKMKTMSQKDCENEEAAADKWKSQHAQRQMHSRPKTPEKDEQEKEHGIGSRLKTRIRRMTSKEVPTMDSLKEDGPAHDFSDHDSTASSANEAEPYQWKPREADEESINHSDVEDLVRWVSRRDPPSDGEARMSRKAPLMSETRADSEHDSIGNSDVDELVHWVSRKSSGPETKQDHLSGYSDASTESDSDMSREQDSSDEEDADDLVRWISHREGPKAGPVRRNRDGTLNSPKTESCLSYDSDVPELGRWIKRHDGTSGESGATTPVHDLAEEEERGRPRSRDAPTGPQAKGHLTHEDVDDLVRWVSRNDSKQTSPPAHDQETQNLSQQEDAKKQQLGMTVDEGSLSHSDVKELIEHVKATDLSVQGSEPAIETLSSALPETGDLRAMRLRGHESEKSAALDHLKASRGEDKQARPVEDTKKGRKHRESLGDDDVNELIKWVSRKS